ncbi:ABC transporter substrate-binding protein [Nocardia blacklockiae]|uniref:ABC transporter substrate-binding protein n=1 Tax=Nocardia blacklockiae TaxID=480036 RepID=UPI001894D031|nr:ABC transporter substrate-binding protein [Nocardia blacklockiae]MBF6175608.1 ABC transporter substrate-binding protein [Nocardia blacklockiae]
MKRPARLLAAVLAVGALATSLAACGNSDSSDPATLTVGFVVDPSWAQIPVAQRAGTFDKHGVRVKVVNFPSGVEALQALAAHQVDVTTAADVPAAATLARSPSLRVVGDGSRWEGSRIVARRSAGITTAAQLAGRTIGTPLGTSAAYFAATTLADNKIRADLVQVAPQATVTAATQRNVDAVAIFQPYQAQVVAALGDDAVALPGGSYHQHSLYLATDTATSRKSAALAAFFTALDEAGAQLTARSADAVAAVAEATQLAPDLLARILPEFDFTLRLQPDLAGNLTALANWAKEQGSVDRSTQLPDYATTLDSRYLPHAG